MNMNLLASFAAISLLAVAANAVTPKGCGCTPAPSFELQATDGRSYTNSSFFGKPTVFVFMKSTCRHAGNAVANLNSLSKSFGDAARLVGVVPADLDETRTFSAQHKAKFLILSDPDGRISTGFQAKNSLDFAYLCENDGNVIQMWRGFSLANVNELIARVRDHAGVSIEIDESSIPERTVSGCPF